jgi:hypothetical protein
MGLTTKLPAHRQPTHDAIPDLSLHGLFLPEELVAAQLRLPTLAANPWPVNGELLSVNHDRTVGAPPPSQLSIRSPRVSVAG